MLYNLVSLRRESRKKEERWSSGGTCVCIRHLSWAETDLGNTKHDVRNLGLPIRILNAGTLSFAWSEPTEHALISQNAKNTHL